MPAEGVKQVIGKDGKPKLVKKKRKPEASAAAANKVGKLALAPTYTFLLGKKGRNEKRKEEERRTKRKSALVGVEACRRPWVDQYHPSTPLLLCNASRLS